MNTNRNYKKNERKMQGKKQGDFLIKKWCDMNLITAGWIASEFNFFIWF